MSTSFPTSCNILADTTHLYDKDKSGFFFRAGKNSACQEQGMPGLMNHSIGNARLPPSSDVYYAGRRRPESGSQSCTLRQETPQGRRATPANGSLRETVSGHCHSQACHEVEAESGAATPRRRRSGRRLMASVCNVVPLLHVLYRMPDIRSAPNHVTPGNHMRRPISRSSMHDM